MPDNTLPTDQAPSSSADDALARELAAFESLRALLRDRVTSVSGGFQNGCYITGSTGTGKTHTVIETLERQDAAFVYRNARMSPRGLFDTLSEFPEHVIVIDDVPTLMTQKQSLQLLMAALGGVLGMPRVISYTIAKMERSSISFRGALILISNVPLRHDPLASAVASRVPVLSFEPTAAMLTAFIRAEAAKGFKDLAPEQTKELAEFVIEQAKASECRLDLRSYFRSLEDLRLWRSGQAERHWKDLVLSGMWRGAASMPAAASRQGTKAAEQLIAAEIADRYPSPDQRHERAAEWATRTGKSEAALYRRLSEIKPPPEAA
jgi:hypothetical protein